MCHGHEAWVCQTLTTEAPQPELHSKNCAPNRQRADATTTITMNRQAAMTITIMTKVGSHGPHTNPVDQWQQRQYPKEPIATATQATTTTKNIKQRRQSPK